MAGSSYIIEVKGILDDSQIRAQIDALRSQLNSMTIGGVSRGTSSATAGLSSTAKQAKNTSKAYGQVNKQAKNASKSTSALANETKRASINLVDVGKKVAAFGAVTSAIQMASAGIKDMASNVFELDKALTDYKKVSDLTEDGLKNLTDEAYKAGKTVSRTGTEMVSSAAMARKSGFSDEDALTLATVAEKFRNVADTELTAEESMGFLVSQIKAFNISAEESESIIDKVNVVGNNFAVGTGDLQTALSKTSSAMSTYGNDINQTIGIITAGTEILVGQPAKVARG